MDSSRIKCDPNHDGGWAWVVVVGSFINHFLFEGVLRSFGVIYLELLDRYHGSAAATAWVQATFNAVAMTSGPVIAVLIERYSCRILVLFGGVLLCGALLASAYSPSLYFLYFTYSVLGGLGAGLVHSSMIVILSQYFDRKRGVAMGLASLGGAIGTVIVPLLSTYLLHQFGYTGCMTILSGLVLHHCVSGLLYRPYKAKTINEQTVEPANTYNTYICSQSFIGSIKQGRMCSTSILPDIIHEDSYNIQSAKVNELNSRLFSSAPSLHMQYHDKDKHSSVDDHNLDNGMPLIKKNLLLGVNDEKPLNYANILRGKLEYPNEFSKVNNFNVSYKPDTISSSATSSTTSLPMKEGTEQKDNNCFCLPEDKLNIITNISFLLFCFNLFNIPTTLVSTFIFLPGLGAEVGLSDTMAAFLISIIGASSAFGRLTLGFIFDVPMVRKHRRLFHSFLGMFLGLSVILMTQCKSFLLMGVVAACIGLGEGGVLAQRATALSQYVQPHQLAFAFGIMTMFQGFGNLAGPVFQGYLKDRLGTYRVCFYYGGGVTFFSSFILVIDYLVMICRRKSALPL